MRLSLTFLAAALATVVSAQNAFNVPSGGYSLKAGSPTTFTWSPTTSGTVTLQLRYGASSTLSAGTTIASSIANSGSFTWTPPSDIPAGTEYTIEILDDANNNIYNYTPQFSISSSNTADPASALASSTGSAAASSGASSAAATASSSVSSLSLTAATHTLSSLSSTASTLKTSTTSLASTSSSSSSSTVTTSASTSTSGTTSSSAAASTVSQAAAVPGSKVQGGILAMALGVVAVL